MTLTQKQQEGLEIAVARYKAHEKYTCIAGYAGSGKAQPNDTLIPTPNGMKELGSLRVGDYVFDRCGQPTKILGVFPQGEKQCYEVIFSDKQSTLCAGDHLWSYYNAQGKLASITTTEMLKKGLKKTNGYRYKVPQNQSVEYSYKNYSIDPYVVGAFLGDGCCKERYLTFSSETEEIPNIIGELINATPEKGNGKNYNWTFRWNFYKKEIKWMGGNGCQRTALREKPKTIDYFSDYKDVLMVEAYNKDIPEEYKYGSIEQRFALVQGLLDTDGSINAKDGHRYNVRFTSTSYKLVKSLQQVLNSLGYSSTIGIDKRANKYTANNYYNLSINIPNEEKYKLFRLKRKKEIALEAYNYHKNKDYSKKAIVDIKQSNKQVEMTCIYVDNKEHLYLTNNYIVTHNTTLVRFIISALGLPDDCIAYCAFTGKAAQVLRNKGCPNAITAHKLLYYARQNKYGKYTFSPRKSFENPLLKVIIVDEVSMLPKTMWDLLLSHRGIYVLALGDPF